MAINFPNTPANNQIYVDTTSGARYIYNNVYSTWTRTTVFANTTVAQSSYLVGDGVTNTFTITTFLNSQNNAIVTIDGLVQIPGVHYSLNGTTLSFSSPPTQYSAIEVRNLEQGPFGATGYVGSRGVTGPTGFTGSAGTSITAGRSIAMSLVFGG